jgi:hypothetical protein
LGGLYLGERSSCLDQIADPVPNDRHHVAILDDVVLIAEAAVPGDDDRAGLARHDGYRGYGQFDETIQGRDLALDATAAIDVDDGKLPRVEYVAGENDIGSPEEREDVAIGVRCSLAKYFDCLAIQVHVFARIIKHLGRPPAGGGRRHVTQNTFGRENWSH